MQLGPWLIAGIVGAILLLVVVVAVGRKRSANAPSENRRSQPSGPDDLNYVCAGCAGQFAHSRRTVAAWERGPVAFTATYVTRSGATGDLHRKPRSRSERRRKADDHCLPRPVRTRQHPRRHNQQPLHHLAGVAALRSSCWQSSYPPASCLLQHMPNLAVNTDAGRRAGFAPRFVGRRLPYSLGLDGAGMLLPLIEASRTVRRLVANRLAVCYRTASLASCGSLPALGRRHSCATATIRRHRCVVLASSGSRFMQALSTWNRGGRRRRSGMRSTLERLADSFLVLWQW